jgi:hypothetical protein
MPEMRDAIMKDKNWKCCIFYLEISEYQLENYFKKEDPK